MENNQGRNNKSKVIFGAIGLFVLVVVAFIGSFGTYTNKEWEHSMVERFGKIQYVQSESGLHFKVPFLDTVKKVDARQQILDLPPFDVKTKDEKDMDIDTFIIWEVTNPKVMRTELIDEDTVKDRIEANIYADIKDVCGQLTQKDILVSRQTDGLDGVLLKEAQKQLNTDRYGIEIVDLQIQKYDFPKENRQAIHKSMISDREKVASKYVAQGEEEATNIKTKTAQEEKLIKEKAKSDSAKIRAEGDREYMKIMQSAYDTPEKEEFYNLIVSYDTLKTAFKDGSKVVVGKDSEIARRLLGNQ